MIVHHLGFSSVRSAWFRWAKCHDSEGLYINSVSVQPILFTRTVTRSSVKLLLLNINQVNRTNEILINYQHCMQSSHSCESTSVKHERDEGRGAEVKKTFTPSPSFILALHASFHVLIYNSSLDHCRWDNGLSKLRLGSCCINHLKCYLGSGRITQFNSRRCLWFHTQFI